MKTMIYSAQQLDFIAKVNKAQAYMRDNNALVGDVFSAYNDLLVCDWWKNIQRPHLQKAYNNLHKRYGYVDKKLFAKCIYNTLSYIKHLRNNDMRFIAYEYSFTSNTEKYAIAYEISKTFRKTRGAK